MSSRKNGADACIKGAASLFLACESNPADPARSLSIPNVMRVKGYSEDKAVNCTLQMQVRQEVGKLKCNDSASAPAVLSAATTMVQLSAKVMTTALTTIMPGDIDGLLMLSLPSLLPAKEDALNEPRVTR